MSVCEQGEQPVFEYVYESMYVYMCVCVRACVHVCVCALYVGELLLRRRYCELSKAQRGQTQTKIKCVFRQ